MDGHQWRCLVRQVLKWRQQWERGKVLDWIEAFERKHGSGLKDEVMDQWAKGNRGKWGDWK